MDKQETTIIIVRHGQSMGNVEDKFIGITDSQLSPLGLRQAQLTAEYLKDTKIDKVYSSNLSRARVTAETIAQKHGLEVCIEPDFREIDAGLWEKVGFSKLITLFPQSYSQWLNNVANAQPDGGEHYAQVYERVSKALDKVISENAGKTILIASHATAIKAMECKFLGKGLSIANQLSWVPNASVTIVKVLNGESRIIERGTNNFLGELATYLPSNC